MRRVVPAMLIVFVAASAAAQDGPQANDVTSAEIQRFINALPRDRVSDRPIRVVEVTGDYRVGVYGVFRPQDSPGGANLHEVNTTEISYMVESVESIYGLLTEPQIPLQIRRNSGTSLNLWWRP